MRSKSGFTLVELLLAAAILAYALSAILASFINTVALNETSRNLSTATTHAEYVLEEIRNTTFASIATNINAGNWNWNTATISGNGLTALNNESIAVTVSGTTLLDVIVTVTWRDLKSRVRTQNLRTLITS